MTGTFAASIASAGMGVQFTLPGMSTGIVELAKPLTRPVFEEGMDGNDLRLFGRFFIRF